MAHNHSPGKRHAKKQKINNKKAMKRKQMALRPVMPQQTAADTLLNKNAAVLAAPSPQKAATPPRTPGRVSATKTVTSKFKALSSSVRKTMTPEDRKPVQNSPSPSPLRWLSFPLRRGDNVKAILFRAGEDSSPMVLLNTPPSSKVAVKGTDGDADSPSPAKPRPLTVDMLATTTPSAADAVNMGSPPAPTSANKKSGHAESSEKDAKAKRRGPAAARDFLRKAGDSMASGGASLKRGLTKPASTTWSTIKRAATCACFKTSATTA